MYDGLCAVVNTVQEDDAVKVLILTGAGKGFCAGSDAKERLASRTDERAAEASRTRILQPVGYFGIPLHRLQKPAIAAINGVCVGAGLSLSLLCDIRIASDKARFGAVWVRRGLIPDVGATCLLPRTIGLDRALEMAFTGDVIDAREAERIGLITRFVPHEDLMEKARALARRIAEGPAVAIEFIKRGMTRAMGGDYLGQLDFESYAQNVCFKTEDFRESLAAFEEKREPRFKGK
jgi:2-(1,2-epoxy-1,2-dihydrophenyl)acetyl-CoA isomerase